MSKLSIYSGECFRGNVGGDPVAEDAFGKDLHVGDVVMLGNVRYIGTDAETITYDPLLSAVVVDGDGVPFVMGIKTCGFTDPEWQIHLVKKHSDVVAGEHWAAWGFNYRAEAEAT